MKLIIAFEASFLVLLSLLGVAGAQAPGAQTPIVTIRLAKDQIAILKTAPGITTRLVFPDQVTEIVCGDLYDPASGRGSFVVQRDGKDVFLKPVATKGLSNMFVKTGQNDENVYSFDLVIVTADRAYRIVNVLDAQGVPVAKSKAQTLATRISPPAMPSIGVIDWNVASSLSGITFGAYSLPSSADVPEPPAPQKVAAPSSRRSLTRVPIHGDPIKRVKAIYPEFAKAAGLNGEVTVEIVVDENGKVISAKPISGPELLRQAALNAALGWRYPPTTVDGLPTQAVGTIKFRFERLADDRNGRVRANGGAQNSSSGDANGRRP
jgi:TonB family protein